MSKVPPRNPQGRRTGYTTGASAAAAARAATRALCGGEVVESIAITLPNRQEATLRIDRLTRLDEHRAEAVVIKDGGDDPDATHGAEIVAEVELRPDPTIEIRGGVGVARVTKPGLGLEVGTEAINPVPRRNITEMVALELSLHGRSEGAKVVIHVPDGETIALQTLNARLGLLGGISILGTTGIVRPFSTAAFRASIVQAIDVARERGIDHLVFTTGGKSEQFAMKQLPSLPEEAFIQIGDFFAVALKHAARREMVTVSIVGMIGKFTKMADGLAMTHAAGSDVNIGMLADLARDAGASDEIIASVLESVTARRVLELCDEHGLDAVPRALCAKVVAAARGHSKSAYRVEARLVHFDGRPIASASSEEDTDE